MSKTSRGGALNLAAEGHKVLTHPKNAKMGLYRPKNVEVGLYPPKRSNIGLTPSPHIINENIGVPPKMSKKLDDHPKQLKFLVHFKYF